MQISYRQGLVSAQDNFLQIGQADTRYVDISVSPTPVVATIAFGSIDYLIGEQRYVTNAWGPLTSATHYLYWDINQSTGALTRGFTTIEPITSAAAPINPAVGQLWFDTIAKTMKEFTGTRWAHVLRVFAGTVKSGAIIIPAPFESQVGLNEPTTAGFIMTDGFGKAFKNSLGQFLTTDTSISSIDTGSQVQLQGAQVVVQANENIPKFSLVYLIGGRAALASGDPAFSGSRDPLAMVTMDAFQNDAITLVTSGQVVTNEQWNFSSAEIGKSIYCSNTGTITTIKPNSWQNVKVGTIMSSNSVLLDFDKETEVPTVISSGGSVRTLPFQIFALQGTGGFLGIQSHFTGASIVVPPDQPFCEYDSYYSSFNFSFSPSNFTKLFKININVKASPTVFDNDIGDYVGTIWPADGVTKFGSEISSSGSCSIIGPISKSQYFRYDGANMAEIPPDESFLSWSDSYFVSTQSGGGFNLSLLCEFLNNIGNNNTYYDKSLRYSVMVEIVEMPASNLV